MSVVIVVLFVHQSGGGGPFFLHYFLSIVMILAADYSVYECNEYKCHLFYNYHYTIKMNVDDVIWMSI